MRGVRRRGLGRIRVTNAAVIACDDAHGHLRLVAYVVGNPLTVTAASLRSHLVRAVPRYMIPEEFVLVDALPLAPGGKVDLRALRASPTPAGRRASAAHDAPRTTTEKALAAIWASVLGLDSVGIGDNFFDLGGHSLLAAQMVARAEKTLRRKVPVTLILQVGTIETLAAVLDQHEPDRPWPTVFPLRLGGSRPPVFCLHGLDGTTAGYRLIIPYLGDDQPVFGIQCVGMDGSRVPYRRVEDMAAH